MSLPARMRSGSHASLASFTTFATFATLLWSTGCSQTFDSSATTAGGGTTGVTGGLGDGGAQTTLGLDLPAVDQDLDESGCEDLSGTVLPGAAVYFLGAYEDTSDGWRGREEVRVFANNAWTSGSDCSVVWTMQANETDVTSCGNCDLGLAVSAQLDLAATTCPEDLYNGDDSFSVTYGVEISDDGTRSTWYFADTGTQYASGYANGSADGSSSALSALNFISDKTCWWF